ncbi:glutathionylspermidine synthase family protein [Ferrimonas sp. SCSIO 43195]|uniref:glutathionylspermidine synthase family protein n=1 Tax=Ferrimonas sp. SCSIO 43195 TaxID=2822844 RepID=UPI002075E193|nr:glutathionylspermidine synthase family protein [Ferrimonas sp. SCSIO 43195]USD39278.1 glutathionylspermidine synthase family protein [Ferrimonas sp. SCSIO 43195]
MQRHLITPRTNWQQQAETYGFNFHTMYGEPYWDESRYYAFTLDQIERDLEDPTTEINQMCLEVVDKVVQDDALLRKFAIPEAHWEMIARSWRLKDPALYARLDLAYDGSGPAKLLENNADTPTSLYESAFFQWLWLDERLKDGTVADGSDQFNSIQEQLIARFAQLKQSWPPVPLHFACCQDTDEDRGTVQYLQDCAEEAGLQTLFTYIESIGITPQGGFVDGDSRPMHAAFKLYPWEFMLREEFGDYIDKAQTRWLEPSWKSVLSNKALLPMLWKLFPNHPNLLPAYFADERHLANESRLVEKPIYSREGANVRILDGNQSIADSDGPYGEEGVIYQAFQDLPKFGDDYALIGSWLVGDEAAGISVREDHSLITQDLSRFVPHIILP